MLVDTLMEAFTSGPRGADAPFLPYSVYQFPQQECLPSHGPMAPEDFDPSLPRGVARYLADYGPSQRRRRLLYLHIPFCPRFCSFCTIYKTTKQNEQGADVRGAYVDSLVREIALYGQMDVTQRRPFCSIYFGGGTPSLLSNKDIDRILEAIATYFPLESEVEITVEGMANHFRDRAYTQALVDGGVTRISYGVQTFNASLRKSLGRIDTVEDIFAAAEVCRDVGVGDLNIDILAGLPGQSQRILDQDVQQTLKLDPDCMDLILWMPLKDTHLGKRGQNGSQPPPSGRDLLAMRASAIAQLEAGGLHLNGGNTLDRDPNHVVHFNEIHYGGDTGMEEMFALGASSWGMIEATCYENVSSISDYCEALNAGNLPIRASTTLSAADARRRQIILGLQLFKLTTQAVKPTFNRLLLRGWERLGLIERHGDDIELTRQGKLTYNMMQLEALPTLELLKNTQLAAFSLEDGPCLDGDGPPSLAGEISRLIAGPVPIVQPIRHALAHWMLPKLGTR